jgi:hypothetical protein
VLAQKMTRLRLRRTIPRQIVVCINPAILCCAESLIHLKLPHCVTMLSWLLLSCMHALEQPISITADQHWFSGSNQLFDVPEEGVVLAACSGGQTGPRSGAQ